MPERASNNASDGADRLDRSRERPRRLRRSGGYRTLRSFQVATVIYDATVRCGKPLVLRTARKGPQAGSQFWGCSAYPACKGTRPLDESGRSNPSDRHDRPRP